MASIGVTVVSNVVVVVEVTSGGAGVVISTVGVVGAIGVVGVVVVASSVVPAGPFVAVIVVDPVVSIMAAVASTMVAPVSNIIVVTKTGRRCGCISSVISTTTSRGGVPARICIAHVVVDPVRSIWTVASTVIAPVTDVIEVTKVATTSVGTSSSIGWTIRRGSVVPA